jgi:hypothetical protein
MQWTQASKPWTSALPPLEMARNLFWCAMKESSLLVILSLSFAASASAKEVVAVRRGVFCISAQALAKLTLPDGSSRASAPDAKLSDIRIKDSGGCADLKIGDVFTLLSARRQTSIVKPRSLPDSPVYYVANIDFIATEPAQAPSSLSATSDRRAPVSPPADTVGDREPDVEGLTIGMPYPQVQETLATKHLDIHVLSDPGKQDMSVFAGSAIEGFLILTLAGKVSYIGHEQYFPEGIAPDAFRRIVTLKYGTPTVDWLGTPDTPQFTYVYSYNWKKLTSQELLPSGDDTAICFFTPGRLMTYREGKTSFAFYVPTQFPADCTKGSYVDTQSLSDHPCLIGQYTLQMYDAQAYSDQVRMQQAQGPAKLRGHMSDPD